MDCERLREEGAELALGVLPARERAEAVAHLDRCPDCRAYVERLTAVGDGLLGLLGAEPPVGFESRVVRAMAPAPEAPALAPEAPASPPAARRRVRRHRFRIAAAGVATAVAFGFGGWAVGTVVESAPQVVAPSPRVLEAALVSPDRAGDGSGREVGRIFAHPGDATGGNGWVYMSVDLGDGPAPAGPVRCLLVRADGSTVALGSFPVSGGYGYWGAPAPVDPHTLSGARLVAADGTVLATAHFSGTGGTAAGPTAT
ncbi:anti-sigma factor family protein [Streptomyces sp. NPDC012756]|uniref:anti-sigma factor family protein n=1 Tax=Streptomyces sp. NPDC012756 TaxID=3364847 RepID=UPI0036BDB9CC